MKKNLRNQVGAAMVEVALLVVLIAVIAIPAVHRMAVNSKRPMCATYLALGQSEYKVDDVWNVDFKDTGSCAQDSISWMFDSYWFR